MRASSTWSHCAAARGHPERHPAPPVLLYLTGEDAARWEAFLSGATGQDVLLWDARMLQQLQWEPVPSPRDQAGPKQRGNGQEHQEMLSPCPPLGGGSACGAPAPLTCQRWEAEGASDCSQAKTSHPVSNPSSEARCRQRAAEELRSPRSPQPPGGLAAPRLPKCALGKGAEPCTAPRPGRWLPHCSLPKHKGWEPILPRLWVEMV